MTSLTKRKTLMLSVSLLAVAMMMVGTMPTSEASVVRSGILNDPSASLTEGKYATEITPDRIAMPNVKGINTGFVVQYDWNLKVGEDGKLVNESRTAKDICRNSAYVNGFYLPGEYHKRSITYQVPTDFNALCGYTQQSSKTHFQVEKIVWKISGAGDKTFGDTDYPRDMNRSGGKSTAVHTDLNAYGDKGDNVHFDIDVYYVSMLR